MRLSPVLIVLLAWLAIFPVLHVAAQPPASPSPAIRDSSKEITIDQEGYKFKVKLDPEKKRVTVNSFGVSQKLPRRMNISLFRDESTGQTVDLRAVPPPRPGETPQFQGEIDWYSGPYVAFEIQIPLPDHTWKRIKKPIPSE